MAYGRRRWLVAGVLAVLAGSGVLAGCGAAAPKPRAPAAAPAGPTPVPSSVAAPATSSGVPVPAGDPNGVTTAAEAFGTACASLPSGGAPGSLAAMAGQPVSATLSGNPMLRDLFALTQKADLVGGLDQRGSLTVFAPDNQAFDQLRQTLGPDRWASLLADQDSLADTVRYQAVGQRYDRAGLLAAGSVPTLRGGRLRVTEVNRAQGMLQVTDGAGQTATVLCGNMPTANATVFVIDKVLLPRAP